MSKETGKKEVVYEVWANNTFQTKAIGGFEPPFVSTSANGRRISMNNNQKWMKPTKSDFSLP